MVRKLILLSLIGFIVVPATIRAQEGAGRDPFQSPFEKPGEIEKYIEPVEAPPPPPPTLNAVLQGIVWSPELKQAIVNGEVYHEGETMKDFDAKILKIEKSMVMIFYDGIIHELTLKSPGI